MPRVARILGVGAVHHVIARFVDRSWQLVGDEEREQYLARAAIAMQRAGWGLIGYALMSSHVHLLAVASDMPLAAWAKAVHVGMALWLNRRFGRLGPVFAGRPYCEIVAPQAVPIVLAYLHNNPVRARVVGSALDSTWTSHRAYLGLAPAPAGLEVARGLALAGFTDDEDGRADFSAWVQICAEVNPDAVTSVEQTSRVLRTLRARIGSAVELATATRDSKGAVFALLAPSLRPLRPAADFDPSDVIQAVFVASGVDLRAASGQGPRAVSDARRVALCVWSQTRQPRSLMARALGLSAAGASQLSKTTREDDPLLTSLVAKASELLVSPGAGVVFRHGCPAKVKR